MTLKINNNNVASLAVGSSNVSAAYIGSTQIYTSTAAPTTFDYVYHIMGLTYVSDVKNYIYGLHF